jgi:bis(5'-adenosyl)-triphosphatase
MSTYKKALNCPFCDESVNSSVFFTQGEFLAIYNIAPVLPGHALVIPRSHKTSILMLSDKELCEFFITARKTLQILLKAFETDSFDWSIQEKPEAGQTIEHLHLHIVPRLKNDLPSPGQWYPLVHKNNGEIIDSKSRVRLSPEKLQRIVDKLRLISNNGEFVA